MRKFNKQFGYKTRKHPIACHQSDIRRWLTSDKTKECRATWQPTGSISNNLHPIQSTSLESYAPNIERLSSTMSLTGAQKLAESNLIVQSILETSLGENQEDATRHDVIIESDDDDRQSERHPQLAADVQRKLPSNVCHKLSDTAICMCTTEQCFRLHGLRQTRGNVVTVMTDMTSACISA